MSIKPQPLQGVTAGTERALLRGGVLQVEGRDAGSFLQAQLMNDVRPLQDGQWQWNGWLTPGGRVIALAALLRLQPERYWLLLPDHAAEPLAQAMQKFVLRSKLALLPQSGLVACGAFEAPAATGSSALRECAQVDGDAVLLDWSGSRPRSLWIGPADAAPAGFDADTASWALEDLAHGLPRLADDQAGEYTPQMLALDHLAAFSVKKGCYPGQEIVARTHFLGRAKRALRRLALDAATQPGVDLLDGDRVLGRIVCAASRGSRHEALAILPLDLADGAMLTLPSAGAVRCITFDPGLAR